MRRPRNKKKARRLTGDCCRLAAAAVNARRRHDGSEVLGLEMREAWKLQGGLGALGVEEEDAEEPKTWPATTRPEVEDDLRGQNDQIRTKDCETGSNTPCEVRPRTCASQGARRWRGSSPGAANFCRTARAHPAAMAGSFPSIRGVRRTKKGAGARESFWSPQGAIRTLGSMRGGLEKRRDGETELGTAMAARCGR